MSSGSVSAIAAFADRLYKRSPLNDEEMHALLSLNGHMFTVRANVDIVSSGEDRRHACLVVDGLAGRFEEVVDGRRQITALYMPGDMCDLHSLVAPKVGWALQALSPTTIMRVPHVQLMQVARSYPKVAEAFWRDCSVDASILSQWVVNVGRRDARSRLAHLICEMAIRLENAGLGTRYSFRLQASQSQLADALGMTSVHVNRTVRALREAELVIMNGRKVEVQDWNGLARLGDFDEGYLQVGPWTADKHKSVTAA